MNAFGRSGVRRVADWLSEVTNRAKPTKPMQGFELLLDASKQGIDYATYVPRLLARQNNRALWTVRSVVCGGGGGAQRRASLGTVVHKFVPYPTSPHSTLSVYPPTEPSKREVVTWPHFFCEICFSLRFTTDIKTKKINDNTTLPITINKTELK